MTPVEHLLDRVWLRSPEEEGPAGRVYRPAGHPLPPARGREGLVLHSDGRFELLMPGRGDRPETVDGVWGAEPGEGSRVHADVAGQVVDLRITEVSPEVLRLEWLGS